MPDVRTARPTLEQALVEVERATAAVLATAAGLDDAAVRAPSLLTGWSRGHVLTHLARNADGLGNLVGWVTTGVETPMYASREARGADIEAGSGRSSADLLDDLRTSAVRLGERLRTLTGPVLDREVRFGAADSVVAGWELPLLRVRELLVHHVDLGVGFTEADWSAAFVDRTLEQVTPFFAENRAMPVARLVATDDPPAVWQVASSGPSLAGPRRSLLAWLLGRSAGADLAVGDGHPVPPAPPWV